MDEPLDWDSFIFRPVDFDDYFDQYPERLNAFHKFMPHNISPTLIFTTLPRQFNTITIPLQDSEAFFFDILDVGRVSEDGDDFFRRLGERREERLKELHELWKEALDFSRTFKKFRIDKDWQSYCNIVSSANLLHRARRQLAPPPDPTNKEQDHPLRHTRALKEGTRQARKPGHRKKKARTAASRPSPGRVQKKPRKKKKQNPARDPDRARPAASGSPQQTRHERALDKMLQGLGGNERIESRPPVRPGDGDGELSPSPPSPSALQHKQQQQQQQQQPKTSVRRSQRLEEKAQSRAAAGLGARDR
ncbi:hypothetical protein M406DRAFT_349747 [Cryphonectria parasitica EP155]|uniref:Uncharacterized protein n=1 Tax=Cryphonectria parasitica (strain ATCC 38755 / EP155) TaxID=660469 RepID=A0A9P4Y837_CRYP1|nr:uncharacterized protein M406DRAFT_349747 [Cryphonectria parasitica EP155]KAF3768493.1 hypothetical protein M406DRAFT_349747 [Cryphonectria parasitica EP155]